MPNKVIIQISGPEHSHKTDLAVAMHRIFAQYGVNIPLPLDPQRDMKMDLPIEDLMKKLHGVEFLVMESQTAKFNKD